MLLKYIVMGFARFWRSASTTARSTTVVRKRAKCSKYVVQLLGKLGAIPNLMARCAGVIGRVLVRIFDIHFLMSLVASLDEKINDSAYAYPGKCIEKNCFEIILLEYVTPKENFYLMAAVRDYLWAHEPLQCRASSPTVRASFAVFRWIIAALIYVDNSQKYPTAVAVEYSNCITYCSINEIIMFIRFSSWQAFQGARWTRISGRRILQLKNTQNTLTRVKVVPNLVLKPVAPSPKNGRKTQGDGKGSSRSGTSEKLRLSQFIWRQ